MAGPKEERTKTPNPDFNKTQPVTRQLIEPTPTPASQKAPEPKQSSVPPQRIHIINETSQTRQRENTNGFNVSYDDSFSAIKTNIFNFKGGNNKDQQEAVSTEEKPNKPDKSMTMEVNLKNIANEDPLNKTQKAPVTTNNPTKQ